MPCAHQAVAVDEAIGDAAAVVRALVVDDDQPPARQARHRNRLRPDPRAHDRTDRHEPDLCQLGRAVIGVITKDVKELGGQRAHVRDPSAPL